MIIQYNVVVTILNKITNETLKISKIFDSEVTAATDGLLYNNYHNISDGVYILDMFSDEVSKYCADNSIDRTSLDIDEFEIVSLNDNADVFFESPDDNSLSLKPVIRCYIHPKQEALPTPQLVGNAYDSNTIIWTWPQDEKYAHYLVEEAIDPNMESDKGKIIAQLPIGVSSYTETGLKPDTPYTRRLINYTDEQTSVPSASVTVMTETEQIVHSLEEYNVPKNYDFTSDDSERNTIEENLEAFHSGVGDSNDLKVYKQMDADFYQKFKAYFEITGRRIEREKRYEQVGFNYKICLEATEEIEEQEGEVTFEIDAYPREWVAIEDYMWSTAPVNVKIKFKASVFLRKETDNPTTEKVTLYKPKLREETTPPTSEFVGNPLGVLFILDKTNSLHGSTIKGLCGGVAGEDVIASSVCSCIDKIESMKNGIDIRYAIIIFGKGAKNSTTGFVDAGTAKAAASDVGGIDRLNTCWAAGLSKGVQTINSSNMPGGTKYITYFFSDGFANTYLAGNTGWEYPGDGHPHLENPANGLVPEIQSNANALKSLCAAVGCFICNYGNEQYVRIVDTSSSPDSIYGPAYIQTIHQSVASNGAYARFWNNASQLTQIFHDFIQAFTIVTPGTSYWVFDGWEKQPEKTQDISYDIDEVKVVTIESDVYTFTFDNTKTPEKYERKEKRTIVPLSSFLSPTKVNETNIYDLIMNKVKQTSEWNAGYNKTIGTVEKNGEADTFLIQGLVIQDTYNFADEDEITANNWGQSDYEDGMEGTVNSFTDIDKCGTTIFGDDCYLVSKNNFLMIQGYTDAIIYDGTRHVRTELNAYDHDTEILISGSVDTYKDILFNRKKPKLSFSAAGGTNPIGHAIDVIEKDDDITFTGYSLSKVGDYVVVNPLTEDLVAYNKRWYQSPVLNYRFNLEDPDAKTPIYEILPDCDPDNNYLHIVILHVYYAKNVWITDNTNYVESFGDDPIAYYGDDCIPLVENVYQWTLKEWKDGVGKDNGWYIDSYLWFMAKPMIKTQDYYDELPGPGMETFYGRVNGRYLSNNASGKKDLTVDTPQFNIPTTVTDKHKDTIRIYAVITEFYPNTALVSYKWETPMVINGTVKDQITQKNGDYIYFSSDNIAYKDIEYYDIISTINMENQEVFDNKTQERIFEIPKPETIKEYKNYYLKVVTDNADVLALRYPTEIMFDENDKAEVGVHFKGVVNATSKWSPRIHNGYYYLNQHEFFAYSEFDVEANFDTYEESNYKTASGYVSFEVTLRHVAKPKEHYSVLKETRSELLQDEKAFMWINGEGVTLKPVIDGLYYKKYDAQMYVSSVILFENVLTETEPLTVDYQFPDGFDSLDMEIRAYSAEDGKWGDWSPFINGTSPLELSSAYQVRFIVQASTQDEEYFLEDYMCCYLDWKDDASEENITNIVTITDHMTTGPDNAEGIYISKILDFGCESELMLDIFESNYKNQIQLYLGYSNDEERLLLENISWMNITSLRDNAYKARYFRYKIVIPAGEKLYWLHKRLNTLKTTASLPFIRSIQMSGSYEPQDIVTNFINTESFEIPKDGQFHTIFNRISDVIGADILEKGYEESELDSLKITCISENIEIDYSDAVNTRPVQALSTPILAKSDIDVEILIKSTPYIFTEKNDTNEYDIIKIKGTPQQFCPITVEDEDGNSYIELHNSDSFVLTDEIYIDDYTKYVEISNNRYDPNDEKLRVYIDDNLIDKDLYTIVNHLIIFNDFVEPDHVIKIEYCILRSFISDIDRKLNTTTIYLHPGEGIPVPRKCKVYFETGTKNNKFVANNLSLNPIYRTDYQGFIYLTDEHNEPYSINVYCNPLRLKAGGYDKVDIAIEVLDIHGNPVISKEVAVDCNYGILNCESYETDMNGVVHLVYESAYKPCKDTLTARVLNDSNKLIEQSIYIENE